MSVSLRGAGRVLTASPREWKYLFHYRMKLTQWRQMEKRGELFTLTDGSERYLVSVNDKLVGQLLYCMGEFEFDKFELVASILGHTFKTVVDIGANVGSICIPAVTRGFASNAIAIEPEPLNFELLKANCLLNGVTDSIDCHAAALGAESSGTLLLEMNSGNFADHRIAVTHGDSRGWENSVEVPQMRLDDLAGDLDPLTDILWMDVQGYEGFVLDGAPVTMDKLVPLVMEFWPVGIEEHSGFGSVKNAVSKYNCWIDLKDPDLTRNPISALENLYAKMLVVDSQTDLLFT